MRKQFTEFPLVLNLETGKLARKQLVETFCKIPGLFQDF
jgi:hypothetical protein